MPSPIEECMRDFAVNQLNKEARGEHTYLDDIPDEEFIIGEALFCSRMANKGLNVKQNRKIALEMISVAKRLLEKKNE